MVQEQEVKSLGSSNERLRAVVERVEENERLSEKERELLEGQIQEA